jgi:hypothetical protein
MIDSSNYYLTDILSWASFFVLVAEFGPKEIPSTLQTCYGRNFQVTLEYSSAALRPKKIRI